MGVLDAPAPSLGRPNVYRSSQPLTAFQASNGGFQFGIDSGATVPLRDFFIARLEDASGSSVTDEFYLSHNAQTTTLNTGGSSLAAGSTSLPLTAAVTMGTTSTVLIGTGSTQEVVTVSAGSGTTTLTCSATQYAHANGTRVTVLADAANPVTIGLGKSAPDNTYKVQIVGGRVNSAPANGMGSLLVVAGNGLQSTAAASGSNGSGFPMAVRDWGGKDRWWIENTASGGWAQRVRGVSGNTTPVYVVQDQTTDAELFRVTQGGAIWFAGDSTAVISRSASGVVQITQNAQVANNLAVGGTAGRAANAMLDITPSSGTGTLRVANGSGGSTFQVQAAASTQVLTNNNSSMVFYTNGVVASHLALTLTNTVSPSVVVGPGGIATNATDGFLYAPDVAGTPTGTPTAQSTTVPLIVDRTNSKLWAYIGGAWKSVTFA